MSTTWSASHRHYCRHWSAQCQAGQAATTRCHEHSHRDPPGRPPRLDGRAVAVAVAIPVAVAIRRPRRVPGRAVQRDRRVLPGVRQPRYRRRPRPGTRWSRRSSAATGRPSTRRAGRCSATWAPRAPGWHAERVGRRVQPRWRSWTPPRPGSRPTSRRSANPGGDRKAAEAARPKLDTDAWPRFINWMQAMGPLHQSGQLTGSIPC